jgi:hypothetical protein
MTVSTESLKRIVAFIAAIVLLQMISFTVVDSTSAFTVSYIGLPSTDTIPSENPFKIVSLSIIIDEASYFDQLSDWLRTLGFSNFTFVVVEGITNQYILGNSTRISTLERYGAVIPRLCIMQGYEPAKRIANANFTLNEFSEALGYTPKGVMDFIPDTYTSQYLLTQGVEYYQGYCFDQYNIDRMTMRGGFQMPYYSNSTNILCPNPATGGMVVLPHSTWDWAASFTVSHNLQLHPLNLMNMKYEGNQTAKNYFLSLIDKTLEGSSPFGFATIQFEWSWLYREGDVWQVLDWLQTLMATRPSYQYLTFEDTVDWFKANYDQTPTYRINFESPYDGSRIEWYYSVSSRVARVEKNVVSYVDFTEQRFDRYLEDYSPIIWGSHDSPTNSIDNSLSFKIDALGGGYLRAPVSSRSVRYDGDLSSFETYYDELISASDQALQTFTFILALLLVPIAVITVFIIIRQRRSTSVERT